MPVTSDRNPSPPRRAKFRRAVLVQLGIDSSTVSLTGGSLRLACGFRSPASSIVGCFLGPSVLIEPTLNDLSVVDGGSLRITQLHRTPQR